MRRVRLLIVALMAAVGLAVVPARAVIVATCGSQSIVVGDTCHVQFTSDGFGYFTNLKPGPAFTGHLSATVSTQFNGFSVSGYYILGQLVAGSDSMLHDLGAGVWTLTVTGATPSLGSWAGTIEAGPF